MFSRHLSTARVTAWHLAPATLWSSAHLLRWSHTACLGWEHLSTELAYTARASWSLPPVSPSSRRRLRCPPKHLEEKAGPKREEREVQMSESFSSISYKIKIVENIQWYFTPEYD